MISDTAKDHGQHAEASTFRSPPLSLHLPRLVGATGKDGSDSPRLAYRRKADKKGHSFLDALGDYDDFLARHPGPCDSTQRAFGKTAEERRAYEEDTEDWLDQLRAEKRELEGQQPHASKVTRHQRLEPLESAVGASSAFPRPQDAPLWEDTYLGAEKVHEKFYQACPATSDQCFRGRALGHATTGGSSGSAASALHKSPQGRGEQVESPAAQLPEGLRQRGSRPSKLRMASGPAPLRPANLAGTSGLEASTPSGRSVPQHEISCSEQPALESPVPVSATTLVPQPPAVPRCDGSAPARRQFRGAGPSAASTGSARDVATEGAEVGEVEIATPPASGSPRHSRPLSRQPAPHSPPPVSATALVPQAPVAPRRYAPAPSRRPVSAVALARVSAASSRDLAADGAGVRERDSPSQPATSATALIPHPPAVPQRDGPAPAWRRSRVAGSSGASTGGSPDLAAGGVEVVGGSPSAQAAHQVVDCDDVLLEVWCEL